MPHIHTGPGQYDLTASAIIIRTDLLEPKVFMNRHLLSGMWAQLGGHVELTESPWSAVQREIIEESGYEIDQLQLLQPKERIKNLGDAVLQPVPVCLMTYELPTHKGHFHTDIAFAFTATGEPRKAIAEHESNVTNFFTGAEVAAMPPHEIPHNVRQVVQFVFNECLPHWEEVATGSF